MANGTMTGSGTQIDPYLVEDVYDFLAIDSAYHNPYYKLVNDIDFNDHETYKYGISTTLFSGETYVDGDGHEVRNMILNGTSSKITANEFKNISFANIILNTIQKGAVGQIKASTFNNCRFGYYSSNSNLACIFSIGFGTFNDCTFNIAGSTYIHTMMNCTFNRCHIHFNNFIHTSNASSIISCDENVSSSKVVFNNTYITGEIDVKNGPYTTYIFYGDANKVTLNNSYFACKITTNYDYIRIMSNTANMTSTCFADKTLISKVKTNNVYGWYLLTTEQCKNNTYLQSIGFQAFPDDSV